MNTIADKLLYLKETKKGIKEAIIEKGVEVTDEDTFMSYGDKIRDIKGGLDNKINVFGSVYSKINNASSNVDLYSYISNNNCAYAKSNALSCELMSNTDGWCLATVITRSPATFPDDWILLKQIEISWWSTYPQVMSIFTRQVVEGEVVNFSCEQLDVNDFYINMIIMNCNGFEANDGTENLFIGGNLKSNTVPKVYNKCVWCCSSATWLSGSEWSSVGLTGIRTSDTDYPRLFNFIDVIPTALERVFTAYNSKATNFMIDSVKIL